MVNVDDNAFDLPKLRVSFAFENDTRLLGQEGDVAEFFDVKFCPYQPIEFDAVFAAVSKKHIVLCRLTQNTEDASPHEVVSIIRDDDDEAANCCCTWARDPISGDPYICVGGVGAKVKIYDAISGRLAECLIGHGGDVNDLATSPIDSSIIASASDDTSVRIWSIDPVHKQQPCLCVLAGEGHSWSLLSLAFHDTGRYLLSAGHDQIINLWTIPDLPTQPVTIPSQVHYPHFSTSAIHTGIVDCVAFYGDLILSRACHDNVIVLWRIEGFSSSGPPPSRSSAPTPQNALPTSYEDSSRLTRSAFVPATSSQCPAQYTRLLEFLTPNCGPQFFMRFRLHHVPDQNPVLAFCNAAGQIFFWDLKRLTAHNDYIIALSDPDQKKGERLQRPIWLKPKIPRQKNDGAKKNRNVVRERESVVQSTKASSADEISPETLVAWATKYSIENSHRPVRAHKSESSDNNIVGRQAAWSPGGEWCVVVGSSNNTLVLQRWGDRTRSEAGTVAASHHVVPDHGM